MAEIIREKLFLSYAQEVPYCCSVRLYSLLSCCLILPLHLAAMSSLAPIRRIHDWQQFLICGLHMCRCR